MTVALVRWRSWRVKARPRPREAPETTTSSIADMETGTRMLQPDGRLRGCATALGNVGGVRATPFHDLSETVVLTVLKRLWQTRDE